MKKYVITLSENFPATHSKKGEPTNFIQSVKDQLKIHTIRTNYDFWKKRIDEIQKGNAELHIRTWSGKPYRSPQKNQFILGKDNGVSIQKLHYINGDTYWIEETAYNKADLFAKNDGLETADFKEWFQKLEMYQELAIIHFTNFRYE